MLSHRAYSLLTVKKLDEAQRIIEGFASTPAPDRSGDVMEPKGAQFSLPIPLLWFHNAHDPIGEVFAADVRDDGIYIKARVSTVSQPGRLKTLVDEAWSAFTAVPMLVRGLSIGWRELASVPIKGTNFTRVTQWIWGELSAVTVPMNVQCTIAAVKAFDVGASVASDRPAVRHPAGVSAFSTVKPMTIAEHVAALELKRDATAEKMKGYIQKQATDGTSLTESEEEEYKNLKSQLLGIDRDIAITRDAQTLNLEKLEPVVATQPATFTAPSQTLPRITVKSNLPKGTAFTRMAMAIARGNGDSYQTIEHAKQWKDTPEVEMMVKAAVAAGTTTDATWAGPLAVAQPLVDEFLELLRPRTLLGRIPGLRRVPFNVSVPSQTTGGTYSWVGQGLAKPVTAAAFATVSVPFAKAAGIIVLTEELVRLSTPSAEGVVREEMLAGMGQFLDVQFVDPAVAAVANVNPASITNGASTAAASGTTAAAAKLDLATSVQVFTAAEIPLEGSVWLMSESNAFGIFQSMNALGQPLFPGMSPSGGTIFGIPVIVTNAVTTKVILVHAPSILFADEGGVRIDVSREASIQMDSAPTNPTDATTVLVSLWQRNLVGLRAERMITWIRARTAAVRYITAAAYTGA